MIIKIRDSYTRGGSVPSAYLKVLAPNPRKGVEVTDADIDKKKRRSH